VLFWWLCACADPVSPDPAIGGDEGGDSGAAEVDGGVEAGDSLPESFALPYASAGDPLPGLSIVWPGPATVDGPFTAVAEPGGLRLSLDADPDVVDLYEGVLHLPEGDVLLYAIVGDPELPAQVVWQSDEWGSWAEVGLASAPYPTSGSSYQDDTVWVALPPGFAGDDPAGAVLHLHGHNATVEEVVGDQYLREQLLLSSRNAVLIVPQGPVEAADSDFGRLEDAGAAAVLLRDVQSLLYRDGLVSRAEALPVALTAHSGGYHGTAAIVDQGGVDVQAVHLFDALYGYSSTFADYALDGGRLLSVWTASGGTDSLNQALRSELRSDGVTVGTSFDDQSLDENQVVIGSSEASHAGCVSEDRNYARWLRASGLPAASGAAPELSAVEADGDQMRVSWRQDGFAEVTVDVSDDGETWTVGASGSDGRATMSRVSWVRVRADGAASDVYGATGAGWWVVDGFDRVLDGSYDGPTHDFAAQVLNDLPVAASVASNEAVLDGIVDLVGAVGVIWLLGDESTADHTLTDDERAVLEDVMAAGGAVVLSGAEVAWATDSDWLDLWFAAGLSSDDADTLTVADFEIGAAYPEDYPDVLWGVDVLWRYDSGGAAAVVDGDRAVVGFGLENIEPGARAAALAELVEALGG
jgi:hypothetical protein